MARRRQPVNIQLGFDTIPPAPRPEAMRQNRRIAFGRVVMPYFFQIDANRYADITEAMVRAADPERLAPHLLPYRCTGGRYVVDGIALGADDFEIIPRSVGALSSSVGNRAERRAAIAGPDQQRARGARARGHALESKLAAMQTRRPAVEQAVDRSVRLGSAAKHPGFATMPASELYDLAYGVRYGDFSAMLDVVGREKDWTAEQADLASRALDVRLFLMPQADKVANWRDMNELGGLYNGELLKLYDARISTVQHHLGAIAADAS